ncbi:MAG: hypothetical protein IJW40_06295 [Clostridia bacterium]|nr:hypothetical protein [Clostridia bacterium]
MKRFCSVFIILSILVLMFSCATEMPQKLPEPDGGQTPQEQDEHEEAPALDFDIFTPEDNHIFYRRHRYFSNLPGMVLVMDQEIHSGGVHLSYIHKTNQKEYYFCFDPLCDHCECATGYAGLFAQPWYFVWSLADQNLYALCGKNFTMLNTDGALYRFDMNTQEVEIVVPTNGNSIREIFTGDRYILMQRDRAEGGCDILRFDPLSGDYQTITPPPGRTFLGIYAAGNTVLVRYMDSPYFHLTDPSFANYTQTALTTCEFIVGNMAYGTTDADGAFTIKEALSRNICSYNILTNAVETLVSQENAGVVCVGCDGDYIYYGLYDLDESDPTKTTTRQTGLYRVSIHGGDAEKMMDFERAQTNFEADYFANQVMCFDGVLYGVLHPVKSTGLGDIYGVLTQKDDGLWTFSKLPVGD